MVWLVWIEELVGGVALRFQLGFHIPCQKNLQVFYLNKSQYYNIHLRLV